MQATSTKPGRITKNIVTVIMYICLQILNICLSLRSVTLMLICTVFGIRLKTAYVLDLNFPLPSPKILGNKMAWWRLQMETFSALLAICARNSPVHGEFPARRPVTQSVDVFFIHGLNERLSKQSRGWWFETLLCPLWRHCNGKECIYELQWLKLSV